MEARTSRSAVVPLLASLSVLVLAAACASKQPARPDPKEEAKNDILAESKKTDELLSKADSLTHQAGESELVAMGAEPVNDSAGTPDTTAAASDAKDGGKDGDKDKGKAKDKQAAKPAAGPAFAAGQRFTAHWTWGGDVKGDVMLSIDKVEGNKVEASLSIASEPSSPKKLTGTQGDEGVWPVHLKAVKGSGVKREAKRDAFTRDNSLRWVFVDADYEIRLKRQSDAWSGLSGSEIEWTLSPAS